ncbi:NAD-dependent epimerase/dehydratase family protein, partial [Candidatus Micrarchaeota archaeon]|nr:NAD-dependent epimerase/dehydratase family protein [Candidatus Micrarchaeota archaeon]
MKRLRVLVTGSTGRLGVKLVPVLLRNGLQLRLLVRNEAAARKLFSSTRIEFFEADLVESPEKRLVEACRNCSAIIHLAGLVDFRASEREMMVQNTAATERLVYVARKAGAKRFVFLSSASVYRRIKYLPIDEKHPLTPDTSYGISKKLAEEAVQDSGLDYVILRPTIIYGPGFDEGFASVVRSVKKGSMKIIGGGLNRVPFVHVDDVVRAVVLALRTKNSRQAYNIAGADVITQKEALAEVAKQVGARPPFKHISRGRAYFLAWIEETLAQLLGRRPRLLREHVYILSEDRIFSVQKARKRLGYRPRVSFKKGLK